MENIRKNLILETDIVEAIEQYQKKRGIPTFTAALKDITARQLTDQNLSTYKYSGQGQYTDNKAVRQFLQMLFEIYADYQAVYGPYHQFSPSHDSMLDFIRKTEADELFKRALSFFITVGPDRRMHVRRLMDRLYGYTLTLRLYDEGSMPFDLFVRQGVTDELVQAVGPYDRMAFVLMKADPAEDDMPLYDRLTAYQLLSDLRGQTDWTLQLVQDMMEVFRRPYGRLA